MRITIRLRVAIAYVTLAVVLLGLSPSVLGIFIHDRELVLIMATVKEWLFVLGTIVGLFWMAAYARRHESSTNPAKQDDRERTVTVLLSAMQMSRMNWGDDSRRVTHMVEGLGRLAGLGEKELRDVKIGALLRDVGHLAIPQAHVEKQVRLTPSEMTQMRLHPWIGSQMLEDAGFSPMVTDIVRAHHERWDGFGYPRGLVAGAIPLAARIVSIVDVWHALGSDRGHRSGWSEAEVLSYLRQGAGSQFDPELTALFLTHYDVLEAGAPQAKGSMRGVGRRHSKHLPQPSCANDYVEEPLRRVRV
ncbi:MAG: HD domain-containing phosphohydrolase [Rhodanobacter sp.]